MPPSPDLPPEVTAASRLQALRQYAVLDTPPEDAFDRLADLAAHVFGVPTAHVSFLDSDRQWVKARVGFAPGEMPLASSFCVHMVRTQAPLVVQDATCDARFASHPLVTGDPGVRFYAGAPLVTPGGHVIGAICVMDTAPHDPPEAHVRQLQNVAALAVDELELRLANRNRRLRLALAADGAGTFAHDPATGHTHWDKRTREIYGMPVPPPAPLPESLARVIHPDDRQAVTECFNAALREGDRYDIEYRIQHPDGDVRHVHSAGIVERDADGTPQQVVGINRDVTDQERQRTRLKQSRERWRRLAEAHRDPIQITVDGKIVYINPAGARLFGIEHAASMIGRSVFEFARSQSTVETLRARKEQLDRGEATAPYEHVIELPGGEARTVVSYSVPITYRGQPAAQTVLRDVTERKAREEALRAARNEAEEANRLKSAFLANMSHEIRTPLTSILGFTEILAEMDLDETPGRFANVIHESGQRLFDTLNSVLDLSKLQAGMTRLQVEPVDTAAEVDAAVVAFEAHARRAGVRLRADVPTPPDEEPPSKARDAHGTVIETDRAAFHRVVTNLVSNAVKFTPSGGEVAVRLRPTESAITLHVADTGVGIDAAFVEHVFEPFRQESSGNAREYEGSGLGLAITARLVDLMGATISVESTKGEGTTFTVTWPRGSKPRPGTGQGASSDLALTP